VSAQSAAPGVQLDAFGIGGRARGVARTLLEQLDRLARFQESQGRRGVTLSITQQQAAALSKSLKLPGGPLWWRGHPVRIVEDL
jgi:hypothetical protein